MDRLPVSARRAAAATAAVLGLALIALTTLLAAAPPAQAAGKRSTACPAGSPLATGKGVRVVAVRRTVVGCARGRRPLVLRRDVPRRTRPLARIAGTTVAVAVGRRARSTSLTRRRTLRSGAFAAPVTAIGVQRGGAFAVVVAGGAVLKVDGEGPGLLDSGPGVDPRSLVVNGNGARWASGVSGVRTEAVLHTRAARGCRPRDGDPPVLAESGDAVVVDHGGLIVGCLRGALSRGVRLADTRPGDELERGGLRVGVAAMAGTTVLLSQESYDPMGVTASCGFVIVDVAARFLRRGVSGGQGPYDCGGLRGVVTPDGLVGYAITTDPTYSSSPASKPHTSVFGVGRSGAVAELDPGRDVVPESLALAGTTLTWTSDGAARSADLAVLP